MEIESRVGELLAARGLTIATAESCTGGLVSHLLTNVAGSSAYVLGGVVAYSNDAKIAFLGVRESTLMAMGAVSEEVAREMAQGVQARFGSHLALSVTGIAGPGGGTSEKPIGLTYIGLATPSAVEVRRFVWAGNRVQNKASSANAALEMVIDFFLQ